MEGELSLIASGMPGLIDSVECCLQIGFSFTMSIPENLNPEYDPTLHRGAEGHFASPSFL